MKGGPKSSLGLFLHRALQLSNSYHLISNLICDFLKKMK